jgi:hypothetical protein
MEGSTGSPSEDDLDRFLADIDAQTKRTEHFWETVSRFKKLDSVRGQNTAPPNFKKRLQAEHMVRGLDEAWVQVIESEVPGEGVSDEDAGLIAEVALEMITGNEESRAWFESRRAQMADLLQQQGLELTEEAEIAIIQLCYLGFSVKARQFISPEHMTSSAIEEARVILNRQNLTDPAWYRLIDIFFNAM